MTAEELWNQIREKSHASDDVRVIAEDGYTYKIAEVIREEIAHTGGEGILWIKVEEA